MLQLYAMLAGAALTAVSVLVGGMPTAEILVMALVVITAATGLLREKENI